MRRDGCRQSDHPSIGRRDLLQVGGLTLIGTGMADLLRLESQAVAETTSTGKPFTAKAKSVVFIFQSGGPSQFETFDPKPEAPAEIRGEYGTVQTKLQGARFCEYFPKLPAAPRLSPLCARTHSAAKRGSNPNHYSLDDVDIPVEQRAESIIVMNEALDHLEAINEQQAKVVEMRFFGGLSNPEIAEALGISERTVLRELKVAKLWLYRELNK